MDNITFLKNPTTGKSVISAPKRAKRTNVGGGKPITVCPFCIGREGEEEELYRVSSSTGTTSTMSTTGKDENWAIRVIKNKFPFVPQHEIVVLSPDHHKSFDELPFAHVELILQTYRERYNVNKSKGAVYIFHNGGLGSGESIPHPHSQIAVVPTEVKLEIPPLENSKSEYRNPKQFQISEIQNSKRFEPLRIGISKIVSNFGFSASDLSGSDTNKNEKSEVLETDYFQIFCPLTSEWPDEVWVAPQRRGVSFGDISNDEITDLAFIISRLIQILDARHGHEFPFNFYIYPGNNWYFRLIPRVKSLGGFELGTNVMINTQDPRETFDFIKEHFWEPDLQKIRQHQQADYVRSA